MKRAVSMVHAYDPEVVVIGGEVMRNAGVVVSFVEAHVYRHAWAPGGRAEVRAAALGDRAALPGGLPLPSEWEARA